MTTILYSTNILRIENFGGKLEVEYDRDERETLHITEEDAVLDIFQLAQEHGKFELYLKTDSMEVKILGVDYKSLKKLKEVIEGVEK